MHNSIYLYLKRFSVGYRGIRPGLHREKEDEMQPKWSRLIDFVTDECMQPLEAFCEEVPLAAFTDFFFFPDKFPSMILLLFPKSFSKRTPETLNTCPPASFCFDKQFPRNGRYEIVILKETNGMWRCSEL